MYLAVIKGNIVVKISYLELWQLFCSVEQKHLCNFGRGHHEEYFCEIKWNLDQWFRRCLLKDFLSRALAGPLFWQRGTICAILVEGIMGNIPIKLF